METGCHLAFVQIGFGNRTAKRTGAPQFNYDQYFTEISQSISTHVQQSKVKVSWSTSQPFATEKKMQFPRYLMIDVWKWTLGEGQVPQQDLTWGASASTLSSSGNVAASLILTVSLCRDATNVHIFTFLAFHFIPPNSPPPHFHFSAFEFIWFVPSSSTRLLHPINGFWIRLESTWLWLVDFKIIPQW